MTAAPGCCRAGRAVAGRRDDLHRRPGRRADGAGLRACLEGGEPDQLLPEARALAARIATNPPRQLRLAKRLLREGLNTRLDTILELAAAYQGACHQTADHEEAVDALLEKRAATFSGR